MEPTILAGFDFLPDRSPAAVVAVEMWEPAFCAGFQAPGKGLPSGWELPRFPPGARHFHSETRRFCPFSSESAVDHCPTPKTSLCRNPRQLSTFTDSCVEPKILTPTGNCSLTHIVSDGIRTQRPNP